MRLIALTIVVAASAAIFASVASAATTVNPATGGGAISADTAGTGGTGAYTTLTGPTVVEGAAADLSTGTIVLNAPSGFQFDATAGDCAGGGEIIASVTDRTTTALTCTIAAASTTTADTLTFSGIKVRPTDGTPLASGNITNSGTATFVGSGGNFGTLTEIAGAATKLVITGSATQTAGVAQSLTITAKDQFDNTATGYTGDKSLTFSGANSSSNPVTSPTVTDKTAAAINFGTATTVTFAAGVNSAGGSMKLYKAESATVAVTDGSISATGGNRLSVTVSAASATRLVITGSASQTAGVAQSLTITATDPYGNTDTGYAADKSLTFSGASSSTNPVTSPTVTNKTGSATNFGTATTVTFTAGASSAGGSMKLYKAESATIAVTDGAISAASGDRLSVTVSAASATRLVITGSATQTAGAAQSLTITATDPYGNTDTGYATDKSPPLRCAPPARTP